MITIYHPLTFCRIFDTARYIDVKTSLLSIIDSLKMRNADGQQRDSFLFQIFDIIILRIIIIISVDVRFIFVENRYSI